GDVGDAIPAVAGYTWRSIGGPAYSKVPSWNADQSYMVMQNTSAPGFLILDGADYHVVLARGGVPGLTVYEARWHPTDPTLMVFVTEDGKAGYWNPFADAVMQTFDAGPGFQSCAIGPWEGNVSRDGRWVVVSCVADGAPAPAAAFFAADLQTG